MGIIKMSAKFCLGGAGYVGLELLYRGRSHISMFTAGGLCFLLLGQLPKFKLHPALRALSGAGLITAVELATGLLVNRSYQVWDYRGQPGNLWGQVCPLFMLIWIPVGMAGTALYQWADRATALLPERKASK